MKFYVGRKTMLSDGPQTGMTLSGCDQSGKQLGFTITDA